MNYKKPEIGALSAAIDAIQSSQVKGLFPVVDSIPNQTLATQAAYEADE